MSYSYSQPQIGTTGIFTFILVTRLLFTHTYYFRTIPLSPWLYSPYAVDEEWVLQFCKPVLFLQLFLP